VVSLAATAIIEDALSAVCIAHLKQSGRHLFDGGVPIYGLKGAVCLSTHRTLESLFAGLIMI
jgi:hypothetical protein